MHPRINKLDKIRIFDSSYASLVGWRDHYFNSMKRNAFISFHEFPFSRGVVEYAIDNRIIIVEYEVVSSNVLNIFLWDAELEAPYSHGSVTFKNTAANILGSLEVKLLPTLFSLVGKPSLDMHLAQSSASAPSEYRYLAYFAALVVDCCIYMSYYREDRVALPKRIEAVALERNQHNHRKHGKQPKKAIKVGVYYISSACINAAPAPIIRHTESWTVRGHMRFNPKTGERDIFVKSYVKGPKRNEIKPDAQAYQIKRGT